MELAGHSTQKPSSFCPAPIAPESLATRATVPACPAGNASLIPWPGIRLAPYRPPWPTQVRLPLRHLDSWEKASEPLPLTGELPRHCHKPLVGELHWSAISPQLPCCQPEWRSPQPA